jgi:hypothetical protein
MGKQVIFLLILMGSLSPHLSLSQKKCDHCFEIAIFQEGQPIAVHDHVVTLKKIPFDIHLISYEPQGIVINTCLSDSNMIQLASGKPYSELDFMLYGMAEEMFNPDQEILIHSHAPSYWYFDDPSNHRFTRVERKQDQIIGIRHIEQMTNVETGEVIASAQFPPHLYLSFLSSVWNSETFTSKEFHRDYLTISFEDQ